MAHLVVDMQETTIVEAIAEIGRLIDLQIDHGLRLLVIPLICGKG